MGTEERLAAYKGAGRLARRLGHACRGAAAPRNPPLVVFFRVLFSTCDFWRADAWVYLDALVLFTGRVCPIYRT